MNDGSKALLAVAVVGGYVLGRTKKGRLALTAATFLVGKRWMLDPKQLAAEGVRRLGELPQVAELQEQLREEGFEAGRRALTAVADRGLGSLADAIGNRTAGPGLDEDDEEEAEDDKDDYEDDYEDEDEDEDEDEGEAPEEEPGRRRRGSRRSAPAERQPAKKTAQPRKSAPAKKATAGKTSAARKQTASPRKTAKKTSPRAERRR